MCAVPSERELRIRLLGGGQVSAPSGTDRLTVASPRAAVVLARLALSPGAVISREALADAVWGERLPVSWQPALRNVVAELRAVLARAGAAGALETIGEGYRLNLADPNQVDVLALEQAVRAAEHALMSGEAATAWDRAAGWVEAAMLPVLPGAYSEWAEDLRRRIGDVREALLLTAARAALELRKGGEAERLVRAAIERAPWREDAHRILIASLAQGGNRAAALAAYQQLVESLERELGTRPSEETERLRRELMAAPLPVPEALADGPAFAEWRRSTDYGLDVARQAFAAGEYQDVIALASRCLEVLAAAADPDPSRRLDLLILLGGAQRALGVGDGFATLRAAVDLARGLEEWERLADAVLAFTHGGAAADEHYVDHTLSELYEEAVDRLPRPDPRRRCQLLGHAAVAYAFERGGPKVQSAIQQALDLARHQVDESTMLATLTLARRAIWGHLDVDCQYRLEEEILQLARGLDEPAGYASALFWRFMTRIEQCEGAELESTLDQADRVVAGLRMGHYHHTLAYSRAVLAIIRGDLDAGEALIEEAAAIGRARGVADYITEALRLAQLEGLRHEQGRLEEIREPALAVYGGAGQPLWLGMVAVIEAETGRAEAAARALGKFLDTYETRGPTLLAPVPLAAYTSHAINRLGDRPQAQRLYRLISSHAGRGGYFAYFPGPIDYYLGLLAKTLDHPEDAAGHFSLAAELCERLGAPLWTDRCRELATRS